MPTVDPSKALQVASAKEPQDNPTVGSGGPGLPGGLGGLGGRGGLGGLVGPGGPGDLINAPSTGWHRGRRFQAHYCTPDARYDQATTEQPCAE